jgi:hypothetical protein
VADADFTAMGGVAESIENLSKKHGHIVTHVGKRGQIGYHAVLKLSVYVRRVGVTYKTAWRGCERENQTPTKLPVAL